MLETKINLNRVFLKGIILSPPIFYFQVKHKKYWRGFIRIRKFNGGWDVLPFVIDEKDKSLDYQEGVSVKINGNLRTRNIVKSGKKKVDIYVYAHQICLNDRQKQFANRMDAEGYICKKSGFPEPAATTGSTVILANNRENGVINYLPCRFFEGDEDFQIGDFLSLKGRIQSRSYRKGNRFKTAYEVFVEQYKKYT